jgi:hypothetical protein
MEKAMTPEERWEKIEKNQTVMIELSYNRG